MAALEISGDDELPTMELDGGYKKTKAPQKLKKLRWSIKKTRQKNVKKSRRTGRTIKSKNKLVFFSHSTIVPFFFFTFY